MEDYSIVTFIPERLDYSECEKSGIFTITGRINGMIKDMYEFAFYLIEDVLVDCIIPEGYRQEINITCKVLNNFYNSMRIFNILLIFELIPLRIIMDMIGMV